MIRTICRTYQNLADHSVTHKLFTFTVKPVYNGHPWDLKNVVVTQRVD